MLATWPPSIALDPRAPLAKNVDSNYNKMRNPLPHEGKTQVEIFNEFKTFYDDGAMNRTSMYK